MQKHTKRFNTILRKIKKHNISQKDLYELEIVHKIKTFNSRSNKKFVIFILICALYLIFTFQESKCIMEMPLNWNVFREPADCDLCQNVDSINKFKNLNSVDFENIYTTTKQPLVVLDGTKGWLAVEKFDFDFFKQLYKNTSDDDDDTQVECQFFPYKTEFKSLTDALNMDTERSQLKPGTSPWYIGWSNCNDGAGRILKNYYRRPYFLPESSENIALNWIFMGGPGFGAHMHVDNVRYPSWQAQIKGRKLWKLAPPPECFYTCTQLEVTINAGEIFVIDTNWWYHQTHILPGDISITIGSEFD